MHQRLNVFDKGATRFCLKQKSILACIAHLKHLIVRIDWVLDRHDGLDKQFKAEIYVTNSIAMTGWGTGRTGDTG